MNKQIRKTDYSKLRQRVYLRLLLIVVAAVSLVFFISFLTNQKGGNWIVAFLQNTFRLDNQTAITVYHHVVRNNLEYITIAVAAIFIIILSRFLISQLSRYFSEVNNGIDTLIQNGESEIHLSPEMAFMEQKLNVLKRTLEKREQEAKQAEQRKNDLVTYLAHDIKTPLTSVIGYLSLLDEAPDMPPEQKAKYVHIGLKKAYRLENLINEFFEITRYNLQTITLSKKDIDLYYMLVQLVDEVYPELAAHDKKAIMHAAEDLTVYGDPDKLARAFNNILKNAICYGEDNSNIEITAKLNCNAVEIEFKNAGSIPKDKLISIFEKFYRLDEARSSDNNTYGAGLGLAIAKEIITMHEGEIYAESENGYTVFTVRLPAKMGVNET